MIKKMFKTSKQRNRQEKERLQTGEKKTKQTDRGQRYSHVRNFPIYFI